VPAAPLQLTFTTDNVAFDLKLERAPSAFTSGAAIVNGRGEAVPGLKVTSQPVFRCKNYGAVLVGVYGNFKGIVRVNGSTLEFDADPGTGTLIAHDVVTQAPETFYDYRHTVIADAAIGEGTRRLPRRNDNRDAHELARIFDPDAIDRWTDCYPGDDTTHALSIGVVIAAKFAATFNNDAELITTELQRIIANANMVYTPQLNFVLTIDQIYIPSLIGESVSWDSCASGIIQQINDFKYWAPPSRQGLWHLFDDCYVSGTIGVATLGNQWNGMGQIDAVNGCTHGACYPTEASHGSAPLPG
jgi:hypothetical protein